MRATSLLRTLLALQSIYVTGFEFGAEGLIVDVRPTYRVGRCGDCGRKVHSVHRSGRERKWRHLDLGGIMVWLRCSLRRLSCPSCGERTEAVPWAESGSWFTRAFEEHVGYLAQRTDKTTVERLMRIGWRTVTSIIQRVVHRHKSDNGDPLDGLRYIGVDELSYMRHHKYVTVVVDHERGAVVWAAEGKTAETLSGFFALLGPERSAKLEAVTIDMSAAYIKAVTEATPEAQIVFDRFHVQRLAHNAVDEVRREEVREAEPEGKDVLKKSRWPTQKHPWNLNNYEVIKLSTIQQNNKPLYRAYLLKQSLIQVFECSSEALGRTKLREWLSWASRSRLKPFVRVGRTIRKYFEGVIAYIRTRLNNGRVEGINGKTRVITRRSFGLHSAASLIALIFLCCGGIQLSPAHVRPFEHH